MALRSVARSLNLREQSRGLMAFYSAVILLSFHTFLVQYINSSYIEQFVSSDIVGPLYVIGSSLTVFIFLFVSRILKQVGNFSITILLLGLEFLAVIGLAFANSLAVAGPLFILHLTVLPLIFFNLDVFLEALIGNHETSTGSRRGLLLALVSFTGAVSPLLSGFIVDARGFALAYVVSAITLFPIALIMISHFRDFKDPKYREIRLLDALATFWSRVSIRAVFLAHLLLQIFFCFMVVYVPLYLATEIQLSWSEIGLIIFIGQLAYVLFEYPIGYFADAHIGEREMMLTGFLILAISTSWIAAIGTSASVVAWMAVMFLTRVGASFVEVTTESYFFKHMKSSDIQIISFFRLTRPLSYVIGALIGSFALLVLPFNLIFVVLGLIMTLGLFCAFALVDTK